MVNSRVNIHRIINYLVIAGVMAMVLFPSVRTSVMSTLQRGLLGTGLMDAEPEITEPLGTVDRSLALETWDGTPLNSATTVGKPIFLHFWASWCPPCVAELPDVHRLIRAMPEEEVVFLLVTTEDDIDREKQFLRKNDYTDLPVYRIAGALPASLSHRVIPTTYVISPSGKIVYRHEGLAQYNHEAFKEFLRSL